jgi:Asp-tRNA(Asn)/Glu-tRNA(Gln) amidotransferase A subunit family amidase
MDTVGPISRTVEDAAITFGAIAGHDPKDPYTWDLPVPDYRNALTGDISSIKVGIIRDRLEDSLVERESREAVSTAISDLGELGASLEDVAIPLAKDAGAITMSLIGVEWSALHRNAFLGDFKAFDHNNRIRFLSGSLVPSQMYYKAQKLRSMLREQVLSALEQVDVLVLPTGPFAALPVESAPGVRSKEQAMADLTGRISFTGPFNLAGVPALSVLCGFNSANLPLGLQIVGRPFDEETVLRVGHAYEQVHQWYTRRPPI